MNSYSEQARLLRLMAHPMRLEILATVLQSEECVCHLSAILNKPQPYVSQQLAVLRKEGLLTDHKEGTNVFYELASDDLGDRVAAILTALTGQEASRERAERQRVVGCNCPKCEPGGTDTPPAAGAETLTQPSN